jgi:hypothetical protein
LEIVIMMIKDLLLAEELDSKVMAGVRGAFSGILSWFFPDRLLFQTAARSCLPDAMGGCQVA